MDSKELQEKLEQQVDSYMKRTRLFDIFYALIAALFMGLLGGFIFGSKCVEFFLVKCISYQMLPVRFSLGFLLIGNLIFWSSFKSLRGIRRRKKWFGW